MWISLSVLLLSSYFLPQQHQSQNILINFTTCCRNPELKYVRLIYDHGENMDSIANKVSSIKLWDLVFGYSTFQMVFLIELKEKERDD